MSQLRDLILEKLNWRYAVQKFDPSKKIDEADWNVLEESLRLAPSSYGLQPWQFWVIQNQDIKDQLKAASWNQSQVSDCSHYVVLLYKYKMDITHIDQYIDKIVDVHGVTKESLDRFKRGMVRDLVEGPRQENIHFWAQRQTYIAMGMLMETAALLNIDTCPMEGLDPDKYDKILGVTGTGWHTIAAVACGYRHPGDKKQFNKKVRFDRDVVFKFV